MAEQLEAVFGSRLHCNFAVSTFASTDLHSFDASMGLVGLSQILVNAVTGIKIAKHRFGGNLVVGWHAARNDVISGVLAGSYGFTDNDVNADLCLDEIFAVSVLTAGLTKSCSLARHLIRVRQLDRARVSNLVFRSRLEICLVSGSSFKLKIGPFLIDFVLFLIVFEGVYRPKHPFYC